MSAALLQSLLEGRLRDPDSGETVTVPTLKVAIAPSLRGSEAALIADLGLGKRLGIIADPATWQAMGARISGALSAQFTVAPVILPERPHADIETVQRVRAATGIADGLIAVGSGTINDLAKYAAFLDHKPYACFGTAPSMNGYTSVNAAIMEGGVKKSLSAAAARGVFLDVEILSKAPQRMIAAGFGDSICRPTAQADWLLAHLLLDQPYRTLPFQLLAEDEAGLLAAPEGLLTGDPVAMTRLARTLVMSGFGMTICGGSYPASQGEHLIAHFLEMRGDPAATSFHGEQIAVTTLTMARIQGESLRPGAAASSRRAGDGWNVLILLRRRGRRRLLAELCRQDAERRASGRGQSPAGAGLAGDPAGDSRRASQRHRSGIGAAPLRRADAARRPRASGRYLSRGRPACAGDPRPHHFPRLCRRYRHFGATRRHGIGACAMMSRHEDSCQTRRRSPMWREDQPGGIARGDERSG